MHPLRRIPAVLAAAILAFALVPAPVVGAGGGIPSWACGPGDTGGSATDAGGSATDAGSALAGRSPVAKEKDLGQTHADLPARAKGRAPADFTATVPVYFHVITDGTVGNLTTTQINRQIAQLNDGFSGGEGGPDSGFTFTLAGVTRTNDAVWFASQSGGAEHAMKRALKQGGDDALNVYSTSGGAYLGWAYLPEITDTAQAYLDGIVISWETVPGASTTFAGQYDLGDTLIHEAGHWINLEHTFYGGCNKSGDFVDDTPAQKSATFGCPAGKDTCKAPGLDPIHNYMDYSYDSCITEFTAGQVQRMRDAWLFYRAPG